MEMEYVLYLQEKKVKQQHIITAHLIAVFVLLVTGVFFELASFVVKKINLSTSFNKSSLMQIGTSTIFMSLVILAVTIFKSKWMMKPKVGMFFRVFEISIIGILSIHFFQLNLLTPAILMLFVIGMIAFALFWENQSDQSLKVVLSESEILLPMTSRKKKLQWSEVDQVLVRFNTITINCADNRLFQWVLSNQDIDIEGLHQFSKQQIVVNMHLRKQDNW